MKVLIIRFSSIGDIVLTTPVVRCLKLQIGAEIHYLTKASFESVLTHNPYISKIYTIEKRTGEVLPKLRKEQYDYIIDLHHNLRTFLIKWRLPLVKSFSFKKLNFEKWLLVNFKINRLPNRHIVDRYLETVQSLGVKNDGQGLDFFLPNDMLNLYDLVNLKKNNIFLPLVPTRGEDMKLQNEENIDLKGYIALPIGAGRNTKALTVEKIAHICQKIDYPVVLLGGKQEISKGDAIEMIVNATQEKEKIFNLVGKCSLLESAAIVKNAMAVLTGDTGLMHIAAAFRRPILSVWGNTIPEFGMYPYYPTGKDRNTTLEINDLPCRPCSKIGFAVCPKEHFKCIEQLEVLEILANLKHIETVQ